MKHIRSWTLGFIALAMITLAPNPAYADAVGPYYAVPSWDQTLPASTRFIVLSNMGSNAVLDRETGLVWEKSPSTSRFTWDDAQAHCIVLNTGGRTGWRLPSIQELMSLVDQSVPQPGPTLPAGHPFQTVQSDLYWAATTETHFASFAWGMTFFNGDVSDGAFSQPRFVWCVRGGQVRDVQ